MGKIGNIAGLFGDVKTRTIVIFTVLLLAVGIGVGVTGLQRDNSVPGATARTAGVPRGIQNIPGSGQSTAQHDALQVEANRRALEAARRSGTSAIPTLGGAFTAVEPEPDEVVVTPTGSNVEERIRQQQERTQQRIALQRTQLEAERNRQARDVQQQETRDNMFKSMGKQAKTLINGWSKAPTQEYVLGNAKNQEDEDGNGAQAGSSNRRAASARRSSGAGSRASANKDNLARAGDMTFAVLSTSVDSDDQGPILATIVSGKLKGSRILGEYEATGNGQRVVMKFNKMTMPKSEQSISINAVAVNPFNGRTGLASSVDNHHLRRYGSLFVASLLKGYGESIKDEGSSIATTASGTTIEATPDRSSSEQLLIALSEVGTTLGSKVDKVFDTKPTVKVKEGVGLGILFLADVSSQGVG